jgi:hypothetical protein
MREGDMVLEILKVAKSLVSGNRERMMKKARLVGIKDLSYGEWLGLLLYIWSEPMSSWVRPNTPAINVKPDHTMKDVLNSVKKSYGNVQPLDVAFRVIGD